MKKILLTSITTLCLLSLVTGSYGASPKKLSTSVIASVSEVFSIEFGTPGVPGPGEKARSSTSITFKTVDGSAPNGWYYNVLASLDGDGDPNDGKSDVAIVCKHNALPFYLKVHKSSDALNDKLGYYVDKAFDAGAATVDTVTDGTVTPGSGFAGTTADKRWGAIPTSATTIYSSASNIYPTYGVLVPISYALVPGDLAAATYTPNITYTMTQTP